MDFGLARSPDRTTGVEEEADTLYLLGVLPDYFASGDDGPNRAGLVDYLTAKQGWKPEYTKRVLKRAEARLKAIQMPAVEDARKRILLMVEGLISRCWNYKTGTAAGGMIGEGGGGGTIFLDDPETSKPLRELDHAAIQGYLKVALQLLGLNKQIVEHRKLGERPLSDLTDAELAELAREEEALRAKPADVIAS